MRIVALATAASAALVAVYLALGGASYAPAKVADPCAARDWREPDGIQEVAEQIVLSAVDGVACELGVSREEVVLAFADGTSLRQLAADHDVGEDELEDLARASLVRAVDDAERAGAIEPTTARLLRAIARRIPIEAVLDFLELLPLG